MRVVISLLCLCLAVSCAQSGDLAKVATSGSYADLSGTPTLSTVATSGRYADLTGTPSLSAVATSGNYSDLTGRPELSPLASSGQYSDLVGAPWAAASSGIVSTQPVGIGAAAATTGPLMVSASNVAGAAAVDQISADVGTVYGPSTSLWQSFTAGSTGVITEVTINRFADGAPSTGYALNIYAGEGAFGTPLFSTTDLVVGTGDVAIPIPGGFRQDMGAKYTWELTNPTPFMLLGYDWATYAGGHGSGDASPTMDFRFQTRVAPISGTMAAVTVSPVGNVGVGTTVPTATLDVNGTVRIRPSRSPASTDPCQPGEVAWDSGFVYVCVDTNTWRRATLNAY